MSDNNQAVSNEAGSVKHRNVLEYLFFALCGVSIIGYYICLILYEHAGFEVPRRITLYFSADILSWVSIATAAIGVIVVIIKSNLKAKESCVSDESILHVYNRYKTINRMLTFTIPAYILALVLAINSYATNPMYIIFIIGICLSTIALYNLVLQLVYNKKFISIGIKTALAFLTLLFFLVANISSIMTFMLGIELSIFEYSRLYYNAVLTSLISTFGFVVCLIISFIKFVKNPKIGKVNPKQLFSIYVILAIVVISLVVFLMPFGNVEHRSDTHFGTYTEDDVSIPQDANGDFVYVEIEERPVAMSASFFTIVSLETGKTFQSYGYKDMIAGEIFLDINQVNTHRYKFRNEGKNTPVQIFFMIDEPISNDFVLVYSYEDILKEYIIPAYRHTS